jgi:putative ABC transport system substrate-binding protein
MCATPLLALAQKSALPVIGFLCSASPTGFRHRVAAFKEGLSQLGFVEGQNVSIEYRWAEDQYDKLPNLAAELVRKEVAIIVAAGGSQTAFAAKSATSTIPIVFMQGGDPVQLGLVASLNRPGGNVTGITIFSVETLQKRLEILKELLPKANSFAVLVHGLNPNKQSVLGEINAAAKVLRVRVDVKEIVRESDFDSAFETLAQKGIGGIVLTGDPIFTNHQERLVALATRYNIPSIYPYRDFVLIGGMMSYGPNALETMRQVGEYAGLVLKGAKTSELPIVRASKIELVINRKVVRSLGLEIPLSLQMRVDEVME